MGDNEHKPAEAEKGGEVPSAQFDADELKALATSSSSFIKEEGLGSALNLDSKPPAAAPEKKGVTRMLRLGGQFGQGSQVKLRSPFALISLAAHGSPNLLIADRPEKGKYRVCMFSSGEFVKTVLECREGDGPEEIKIPKGLACDAHGTVYLGDAGNNRVQRFDASGAAMGALGKYGNGPGEFDFPCDLDLSRDGVLYVADSGNDRIQKLTAQGVMLASFGPLNPAPVDGTEGADEGEGEETASELDGPSGVSAAPDGSVYVADTNHHRIVKYSPDGQKLLTFGSEGSGDGQFVLPSAVVVSPDGHVIVADNGGLQKFSAEGEFRGRHASDLSGTGGSGIATDPEFGVLVCNTNSNAIECIVF